MKTPSGARPNKGSLKVVRLNPRVGRLILMVTSRLDEWSSFRTMPCIASENRTRLTACSNIIFKGIARGAWCIGHRVQSLISNIELRILKGRQNFKIEHSLFNIHISYIAAFAEILRVIQRVQGRDSSCLLGIVKLKHRVGR